MIAQSSIILEEFYANIYIFRTEINDRGQGRTVTVWFEIECEEPDFWDIMPVTIIYKDKELILSDIAERTDRFFEISVKKLHRKYIKSIIGECSDI